MTSRCYQYSAALLPALAVAALLFAATLRLDQYRRQHERQALSLEFSSLATQQRDRIALVVSGMATALNMTAAVMEMLPPGAATEQVYPLLSRAADPSNAFIGDLAFLEHLSPPYTEDRVASIADNRGVNPQTYNFSTFTPSSLLPFNFSEPDAYVLTHASNLPPHLTQAELQGSSMYLVNYGSNASRIAGAIEDALHTASLQSTEPFTLPSGDAALAVLAPVYFNEWSAHDSMANLSSHRGVVMHTVSLAALRKAVDLRLWLQFSVQPLSRQPPIMHSAQSTGVCTSSEETHEGLVFLDTVSMFGQPHVFEACASVELVAEYAQAWEHSAVVKWALSTTLALYIGVVAWCLVVRCRKRREAKTKVAEAGNKASDQAQGRMHEHVLGYVYHEIRNPLNVILGVAELIQETLVRFVHAHVEGAAGQSEGEMPQLLRPLPRIPSPIETPRTSSFVGCEGEDAVPMPAASLRSVLEELAVLRGAGLQIEQHMHDVLDFRRLRERKLPINPLPLNLRESMRTIIDYYTPHATVPLSIDLPPSCPRVVVVDGTRLRQIVTNGLMNAIMHTRSGNIAVSIDVLQGQRGTETLRSARWHTANGSMEQLQGQPAVFVGDDSWRIPPSAGPYALSDGVNNQPVLTVTIRDTGTGLQPHCARDVLRKFSFGEGQAPFSANGTGLGLPICAMLAEAMGGGVTLEDASDGCVFQCILPVELRDREPRISLMNESQCSGQVSDEVVTAPTKLLPCSSTGMAASLNALIVDDDPTNVKLARRMLKLMDVTSMGISSGDITAAVKRALRDAGHLASPPLSTCKPFDVVLLDIRLGPTLSGVDILKEVKPMLREGVPFFAMTANTHSSDVEEYKAAGFAGLLAKPVSRAKLSSLVTSVRSEKAASFVFLQPPIPASVPAVTVGDSSAPPS